MATTRTLTLLLILLCSAGAVWRQEPSPQAPKIKIPAGTPVEIELRITLSTKTAAPGNAVEFVVSQPVIVNGATAIQPCTPVRATVSEAEPAKSFGQSGKLVLSLEGTAAVDGSRVPLRFAQPMRASRAGSLPREGTFDLSDAILATELFPLVVALAARKGEEVGFPAGERFEVYVGSPAEVVIPAKSETAPRLPCVSAEPAPAAGPPTTPAPSEAAGSAGKDRYRFVKESSPRKMRDALNQASDSGHRLLFGGFGWALMERTSPTPSGYRYVLVPFKFNESRASQNSVNFAGALGYRLRAEEGWLMSVTVSLFGGEPVSHLVLEKAPHPRNFQYLLGKPAAASPRPGFRFSGFHRADTVRMVSWEQRGDATGAVHDAGAEAPGDFLYIKERNSAAREQKVREAGTRGYRVVAAAGNEVALEKSAAGESFEYRLLEKKKPEEIEAALNAAAAEGFRLHPGSFRADAFVLERPAGAQHKFLYRQLRVQEAAATEVELEKLVGEGFRPIGMHLHIGWSGAAYLILEKTSN